MSNYDKAPLVRAASLDDLRAVEHKAAKFQEFLDGSLKPPYRFFEIDPRKPASLELHAHFLGRLNLPEIVPPPQNAGEELVENVAELSGRTITRQVIFLDRNVENYSSLSYVPVEGSITAYYFGQTS